MKDAGRVIFSRSCIFLIEIHKQNRYIKLWNRTHSMNNLDNYSSQMCFRIVCEIQYESLFYVLILLTTSKSKNMDLENITRPCI